MALSLPDFLSLWRPVELSRALDLHRTTASTLDQLSWLTIALRSGLIYHEIEATIVLNGSSRSHDRLWPSIRLHDRIKRPQNRAKNSSLKTCISRLCSSTFDRFVKKLSKFWGRSLLHRDPPAFRLDCELKRD